MWCNTGFAECVKGDCINGQGTFTWSNGSIYIGEWKDGRLSGQGTFISEDGSMYIGKYKGGLQNGKGKWKPS